MPVGGGGPDTVPLHLARSEAGDVGPAESDCATARLAEADDRLDELILAVPGPPRDPEDLAGADLDVDRVDHLVAAVIADRQTLDLERGAGRTRFTAIHRQR